MERLCLDFVNSEFRNYRGLWTRDDLQNPAWITQFLQRWHLPVTAPADAAILTQLTELRMLLVRVITTLTQREPITEQDLVALNTHLRQTPFIYQITTHEQGYQLSSVPTAPDWNWVQSEIIADFMTLLTEYDPQRLRICANAHCRWIFYDETKSRTRRYCTIDKCANLVKLRRFREKQKVVRGVDI